MPRSCQILDLHIHNNTEQYCAHYGPPFLFCAQLICQIFSHLHLYMKTWGWEENNKAIHYIWSVCLSGLKWHRTKSSLSIDPREGGGGCWNISANIWWIATKRSTDIYCPRRIKPNDFGDTATSPFASPLSQRFHVWGMFESRLDGSPLTFLETFIAPRCPSSLN